MHIKQEEGMKFVRPRAKRQKASSGAPRTLLHRQRLLKQECACLRAASDAHAGAELRVPRSELARLARREREPGPVVALFSTGGEPVSLSDGESVLVEVREGAAWCRMVIVAQTAYTGGMRVSGVIRRAIVQLDWA